MLYYHAISLEYMRAEPVLKDALRERLMPPTAADAPIERCDNDMPRAANISSYYATPPCPPPLPPRRRAPSHDIRCRHVHLLIEPCAFIDKTPPDETCRRRVSATIMFAARGVKRYAPR